VGLRSMSDFSDYYAFLEEDSFLAWSLDIPDFGIINDFLLN